MDLFESSADLVYSSLLFKFLKLPQSVSWEHPYPLHVIRALNTPIKFESCFLSIHFLCSADAGNTFARLATILTCLAHTHSGTSQIRSIFIIRSRQQYLRADIPLIGALKTASQQDSSLHWQVPVFAYGASWHNQMTATRTKQQRRAWQNQSKTQPRLTKLGSLKIKAH